MSGISSELTVNTQARFDQTLAQTARLDNGGSVVTWVDWAGSIDTTVADGSWSGIKAQLFASNGTRIGREIVVNSVTLNLKTAATPVPRALAAGSAG